MGRLLTFVPSIIVLLTVAIAFRYILVPILKPVLNVKQSDSEKQNKLWKIKFFLTAFLYSPVSEELIFRAPIILIFADLSEFAWLGIIVSAIIFSSRHWKGEEKLYYAFSKKKSSEKAILKFKIGRVSFTFILGLLAGYLGIKHQSLYVPVVIHFLWNTLGLVFLSSVATIYRVIVGMIIILRIVIRRRRRKRIKKIQCA